MTREPDIYIKLYQTNTRGDDTKAYQIFSVPIGNAKTTDEIQFRPAFPVFRISLSQYW